MGLADETMQLAHQPSPSLTFEKLFSILLEDSAVDLYNDKWYRIAGNFSWNLFSLIFAVRV